MRFVPFIGILIGCVVLLFVSPPVSALDDTSPTPADVGGNRSNPDMTFEAYQSLLDDAVAAGLPGVIMLVDAPEHGRWTGASGMRDVKGGIPMTPGDISRIGSVSKLFTAVSVMMLAEEGLIALDDPVVDYLPPEVVSEVGNAGIATIRQLLNHTSGIYNYTDNPMYTIAAVADPRRVWSMETSLRYAAGKGAYSKPGDAFHYANTNYLLLGMIVEEVTGRHPAAVITERIIEPLGLEQTFYDPDNPEPEGVAEGYMYPFRCGFFIPTTHVSLGHYTPDGAVISSAGDLCELLRALFSGDLLSPESFDEMQTWVDVPEPEHGRNGYGLGLRRWDTPFGTGMGHSGGMPGYLAEAFSFPEHDVTYILLVNGSLGRVSKIVDERLNAAAMEAIFTGEYDW